MPKKKAIELVATRRGTQICEVEDRYDVLLHGALYCQLYFNCRGYVGRLPTPDGLAMDIGERSITVYKREVAALNREFAESVG